MIHNVYISDKGIMCTGCSIKMCTSQTKELCVQDVPEKCVHPRQRNYVYRMFHKNVYISD